MEIIRTLKIVKHNFRGVWRDYKANKFYRKHEYLLYEIEKQMREIIGFDLSLEDDYNTIILNNNHTRHSLKLRFYKRLDGREFNLGSIEILLDPYRKRLYHKKTDFLSKEYKFFLFDRLEVQDFCKVLANGIENSVRNAEYKERRAKCDFEMECKRNAYNITIPKYKVSFLKTRKR